jgi:hypothetical protein
MPRPVVRGIASARWLVLALVAVWGAEGAAAGPAVPSEPARLALSCPGLPAHVEVTPAEAGSAVAACAGVRDALDFLHWLPRDPDVMLRIEIVPHLPDGLRPDAVGCYAIGSRRLMVLERRLFLQRGTWFEVPVSPRLWRSVIAHEVAHALVGCHLQGRPLAGAAHEYVAYVTMFATLDEATRAAALSAMPGDGFRHEAEINDFRYALDPMRFGADAYRHWLRQPDGVDFLRSLVRGSIAPEMPP